MAVRVVIMLAIMTMIIYSVKQGVALRSTHPLGGVVDEVNDEGGPYIGLVMAYPTEEAVLLESGLFIPSSYIPSIRFTGRSFNIGTIRGVDVIYVMTGEQTVNAGVTVQILLDLFDIVGVVHYGIAGSTNDSLLIGDVSVPSYLAFTDSWEWTTETGSEDDGKELKFWEFNDPKEGGNLLGKVIFTPTQLFSNGDDDEQDVFWMPVDAYWFHTSTQIQGVNLTRCMNETECVPNEPKIVYGVRGSTANVFLKNPAYRKFLYNEFNVSTVDEESAAVVMTSLSNGVPCIVFRAITDMAGAIPNQPSTNNLLRWSSWSYVAAANALNVAVEFIELIGAGGAVGGGAVGGGAAVAASGGSSGGDATGSAASVASGAASGGSSGGDATGSATSVASGAASVGSSGGDATGSAASVASGAASGGSSCGDATGSAASVASGAANYDATTYS